MTAQFCGCLNPQTLNLTVASRCLARFLNQIALASLRGSNSHFSAFQQVTAAKLPKKINMFRFLAISALLSLAAAAPGFLEQHHVVAAPVVAKVGHVVHTAPVATSHQSFTRYHNQAVITPVVKHVVPVVPVVKHVAPVVPVVKHVAHVVPVVKTIATPVVEHHTYVAAPVPVVKHVAPVVPVLKTYAVPHAVSHQSHTQIHQKAILTPVVKTVAVAAPVAHFYHH